MRSASVRFLLGWSVPVFFFLTCGLSLTAQAIRLHVDLSDAPRNIYHAHLQIPAHAGEMSLVFPKFIPGNHRPSGRSARSLEFAWKRQVTLFPGSAMRWSPTSSM